jgi:Outer membrane protein beta-barrel family/Carboxypeptidase regulatory-like domain
MTRLILAASFILVALVISAQNYTIKGKVQDTANKNLIGAVTVALNPVDSVLVGFAATESDGSFVMNDLPLGSYNFQVTYIGYGTIQRLIEVKGDKKTIDLGVVVMNEEGKMLDAVTISAEYVPIKVTKDTLEFNAYAFKTQPNAVVEDLLKKLPGVEVDAEGGIKVQGEDVIAVTVDGKEFFGKDPKMATKNLPADAVKKVQVFDKKSKTSQFTGVDDGQDEKTINIELKEDKKSGYFGNVMAGYGTDDRYEGKAMLNRFDKKMQLSFIGGLNNLNNTGISVSDFATMSGGGGGRLNFNTGAPVSFNQNNSGETQSGTAGLNLNYDLGNKNKVNFSYYLTQNKTDLREMTNTNSFQRDLNLINIKSRNAINEGLNHNFYTVLDLKIDSTTELTFTGLLGLRDSESTSDVVDTTLNNLRSLLNLNIQDNKSNTNNDNYSLQLNLRKKLNKIGRTITLDGSYGNTTSSFLNNLSTNVSDENLVQIIEKSVLQFQNQNSVNKNYSVGASYTEPLSKKWFLTINASRKNNKTDLIKDFFDLDPLNTTIRVLNEELSRTFDNTFVYNLGGANVRFKNEVLTFSTGLEFQNSNLDGIPSVGAPIDRNFNYFLPKATLEFEKTNIFLNYSTSVREPSMDQLQPVIDNSNPLNIYIGNPKLVPEYRHNLRIRYNFFDQFNFRSLFATIRMGYTENRITTSSFIDQSFVRTQTPLNTDQETTLAGNINYSSPLNFMKAKFRVGVNSSLTNGINFINQDAINISRLSNGVNVMLENKTKTRYDASIGGRLSFNNNIYKNNESLNSDFVNQTYDGYLALFAGKGWTIDTRMEYNIYGQGSFDEVTSVKLWQASISKGFMANKLTAKLRVFDILNQNQGVNRTASETYIEESISNTIGRYILLNVTYALNALSAPPAPSMMMFH